MHTVYFKPLTIVIHLYLKIMSKLPFSYILCSYLKADRSHLMM